MPALVREAADVPAFIPAVAAGDAEHDWPLMMLTEQPTSGGQHARTAVEHLVRDVPVLPPELSAAAAREGLTGRRFAYVGEVAVCRGTQLMGLLPIETLLAAPDEAPLGELMDPQPLVVGPEVRQEVAAWRAVRHGAGGVPVVDASGGFLGIVPPRLLVRILLEEHEEDLARLGGYLHETSMARSASEEPVRRRLRHRLPWLLIGLIGAMISTGLMSASEDQLAANVALAFFLPGIVYMADAVGTQTETLVIRGLSVGVSIRSVVRREALTGVLVGLALSAVFLPFSLLYGDARVALTAALALLSACTVATLVAMGMPSLLHRLGRDPAFGAGPLATVVQDLLSISVYLILARLLVG